MTYIAAHAIGLALLLVRTERGADAVDGTGLVPIALAIARGCTGSSPWRHSANYIRLRIGVGGFMIRRLQDDVSTLGFSVMAPIRLE
jgi:hypothetical protein